MASQNNANSSIPDQTTPNHTVPPINFGKFEFLLSKLTDEELQIILNPPLRLVLTVEELFGPAKRPSKNPNPPRSLNAYFLWRRNYDASQPHKNCTQRSKYSSVMWKRSDDRIKRFFKILSELHKIYHGLKYPQYKYHPRRNTHSKAKERLNLTPLDYDNEVQENSTTNFDLEDSHIDIKNGLEVSENIDKNIEGINIKEVSNQNVETVIEDIEDLDTIYS
ncbi:24525_t:CDS:2, partial [Cetraspora pellucida]